MKTGKEAEAEVGERAAATVTAGVGSGGTRGNRMGDKRRGRGKRKQKAQ